MPGYGRLQGIASSRNSSVAKRFLVEISAVAERDISEIWDYISEDSESFATRFVLKLEKEIVKLDRFPEKFPFIP